MPSQRGKKSAPEESASIPGYVMRPLLAIEAPTDTEINATEVKIDQSAEAAEAAAAERVRAIKASLKIGSQSCSANY